MTPYADTDATAVIINAHAKVNLSLHVVGRRDDGYHELESIIAFIDIADRITLQPADEITLSISGPESMGLPGGSDNLTLRAARWLRDRAGESHGVAIALEKHIPVAAGLGGGSADAAAVLGGCARLWKLSGSPPISDAALATDLGADVPVCRFGKAAFVTGIGERYDSLPPWPKIWVVLVNPRVSLPTAHVFRNFSGPFKQPEATCTASAAWGESASAFVESLSSCSNSLTESAVEQVPAIEDVLTALEETPGCHLARMSGSGPTCFGLFATQEDAVRGAAAIADKNQGWWTRSSRLLTAVNPHET